MGRLNTAIAATAPEATATPEQMREACWKWNQWAREHKIPRWWHIVETDDGKFKIETREGDQALRVRSVIDGWKPDYHGWSQDRLATEFFVIRKQARMGMPEGLYAQSGLDRRAIVAPH